MANFHRNSIAGDATVEKQTITFSSLQADFAKLQDGNSSFVSTQVIGKSERGLDIQALIVGTCPSRPILICGCHWGREWMSVEMPYLFADYLVNNYKKDDRVTRIVDGTKIWFVPMVNPDGHEHTVSVYRGWIRNDPKPGKQSVLLNRNYDTSAWPTLKTAYFNPDPARTYYRGPSPGFAAEVQAMQKLVLEQKFNGVLSYHANGRFVVFPPADSATPSTDTTPAEIAATLTTKINEKFTALNMAGNQYESVQDSLLYAKMDKLKKPEQGFYGGSLTDFASQKLPDCVAVGILLEPDRTDKRAYHLPASEIDRTFKLHLASMLTFLNCVTTARKSPAQQTMKLPKADSSSPDSLSKFVVYQTDCSKAFPSAEYPKL